LLTPTITINYKSPIELLKKNAKLLRQKTLNYGIISNTKRRRLPNIKKR
jgi:hypothetical protein